ncbi:DUF3310 domain-containing protein [Bacillus sp. ISL-40]|uniref:DUF3310 domain-containing protein n=1 Tax=unclassified Bacillus (in: firmicutes) TaxID=185979 RepID=UPI001BEC0D66|nr:MULTISPECIES: DUF3310 domain-containing protein [unclassified Bacillus (in: firmicutes)]MBT2696373.1 DUF3310 domain-containing protein [Bacillus sp. ISL-40]MBT2743221.1 DUF3310 domain-containing protein [Bacillus sp. ISL-77]
MDKGSMETLPVLEDLINKPSHYHKGGIDVIAIMELYFPLEQQIGFHRGNMLKYLLRYRDKGGIQDLEKSGFYAQKLIELEKKRREELGDSVSGV